MFKTYFNFDFTNVFDVRACLFPIQVRCRNLKQIYSQATCMLGDKFFHKCIVIIMMIMMMMMTIIIIIIITINNRFAFISNKDIAVRIRFMSIFTHVQLVTL
jgi:hypothetical protein